MIKNGKGSLYGIQINKRTEEHEKRGGPNKETALLSINEIHEILGHPCVEITKATAAKLELKGTGEMSKCEHYDIGKMRKQNISKKPLARADIPGERVYMDISSIKYRSAGGSKFWVLFVDDFSNFLFGTYMKKKSDLKDEGIKLINMIRNNYDVTIKII